jgi:MFS family permease
MESKPSSTNSVVEPFSMPKMKLSSEKAAILNAFTLSFAAFFGFLSIFAAIAGFTNGDWLFSIPVISSIFINFIPVVFITALLSLVFSILGILTLKKITDKKDLVKPWHCVAKIFLTLAVIYGVSLVAFALYSLLGVGKKSVVNHKSLWLNGFLPNLIAGIAAGIICWFAKQIAAGKIALLRTFSMITVMVASLSFILVIISTLVTFYPSNSSNGSQYDNIYNDFWDLFR